jgi:ribosomal protein S6--L-glutamate ligase
MHICIIIDKPRYRTLPLVSDLMQGLSSGHTVTLLDLSALPSSERGTQPLPDPLADLYLLKSHGPRTLKFAYKLEQRGALVVNSWAATLACQDRVFMMQMINRAGLPWPHTQSYLHLGQLATDPQLLAGLTFPLVIKSRNIDDDELMARVCDVEQLRQLALEWPLEPVILQEWLEGDGWDTKVWIIDGKVFAARQHSPLEYEEKDQFQLFPEEIEKTMYKIALEAGRVFGLHVYGVDFITTAQGPVAVDVNAFPGMRNLVGPDKELVTFIERLARAVSTKPRLRQLETAEQYL